MEVVRQSLDEVELVVVVELFQSLVVAVERVVLVDVHLIFNKDIEVVKFDEKEREKSYE